MSTCAWYPVDPLFRLRRMIVPISSSRQIVVQHGFHGTAWLYWRQENERKSEQTGVNEYGIKRAQTAEIEGKSSNISRFRFSVAPMMEWTDRHCRFLHRGDEGKGRDPGDREVPDRHRRAGPGGGAGSFCVRGRGGGRGCLGRARAQGVAQRAFAA